MSISTFRACESLVQLAFENKPGIQRLIIPYNGGNIHAGSPFLALPGKIVEQTSTASAFQQTLEEGSLACAFYAADAWLVEANGIPWAHFHPGRAGFADVWEDDRELPDSAHLFQGHLATQHPADPDTRVPFVLGFWVQNGRVETDKKSFKIHADENGLIRIAFALQILKIEPAQLLKRLLSAPTGFEQAETAARNWLDAWNTPSKEIASQLARVPILAEEQPLFIETTGLEGHALAVPGLVKLKPELAAHHLLTLIRFLREDGKLPTRIHSTWSEPGDPYPPTLGWAARRLVAVTEDKEYARSILVPLVRNNIWWLRQRMTPFGVVAPSFEKNPPFTGLEVNSHLLAQMRSISWLARFAGEDELAHVTQVQADSYAQKVLRAFYDMEKNRFEEMNFANGHRIPAKPITNLLPLWAGVPLEDDLCQSILDKTDFTAKDLHRWNVFPIFELYQRHRKPASSLAEEALHWLKKDDPHLVGVIELGINR